MYGICYKIYISAASKMHFKSSYIKFDLFRLMEKRFPAICLKQRTHSTMKNRGARDRVLLLPFSDGTKRKVSLT